jgi:hypothetical protein
MWACLCSNVGLLMQNVGSPMWACLCSDVGLFMPRCGLAYAPMWGVFAVISRPRTRCLPHNFLPRPPPALLVLSRADYPPSCLRPFHFQTVGLPRLIMWAMTTTLAAKNLGGLSISPPPPHRVLTVALAPLPRSFVDLEICKFVVFSCDYPCGYLLSVMLLALPPLKTADRP